MFVFKIINPLLITRQKQALKQTLFCFTVYCLKVNIFLGPNVNNLWPTHWSTDKFLEIVYLNLFKQIQK